MISWISWFLHALVHLIAVVYGAAVSFFTVFFHAATAILQLSILAGIVAIIFTILFALQARFKKSAEKKGTTHGFVHVHPDSNFVLRPSIAAQIEEAAEEEGEEAEEAEESKASEPVKTPGKAALKPIIVGSAGITDKELATVIKKELAAVIEAKESEEANKPVIVMNFTGDVMATGRQNFAKLVDEILVNRTRISGVVVIVSSPGGAVSEYGHMYSEMERIRNANVDLTVCTDTYAASGGYLMSLPANRIIAAPFAMVGSIGVVTEFLNFNGLVKNLGIKPLTVTAGEHKRNVTQFNDPTDEAVAELTKDLVKVHDQFKSVVHKYRPQINVNQVCTGAHWTAQDALTEGTGLVDEIATSQDYIFRLRQQRPLMFLSMKQNPFEKGIFRFLTKLTDYAIERLKIATANSGLKQ